MGKLKDPKLIKFKNREKEFRSSLPENSIVGIRLDGKSFHTFTKQFDTPYDLDFMSAMDETALFILEELITDALFAYVQSDEITIFFTDLTKTTEATRLFDGAIQKILSTSASAATGGFMRAMPQAKGVPIFDSRVFLIENLEELQEYMDWRRMDARKNSISMAADTLFTPKQLEGMSTRERLSALEGTRLERLPEGFMWGRLITREEYPDTVSFTHKKTKEPKTIEVIRSRWAINPAFRDLTEELIEGIRKSVLDAELEAL